MLKESLENRIPISTKFQVWSKTEVLQLLLVGVAFYLSAKLGRRLSLPPDYIAVFWPPNTIILTTLLLIPQRRWWAFLLTMLLANFTASYLVAGFPIERVLIFMVANCSEVLVAAFTVRYFLGEAPRFASFREVVIFTLCAVGIAPLVSSFVASLASLSNPDVTFSQAWHVWFLGDALAHLTLTPLLLVLITGGRSWFKNLSPQRYIEAGALMIGLVAVGFLVFGGEIGTSGNLPVLVYLPLPLLLWATVRFGPHGACIGIFLITILSIWHATHGRGPFTTMTPDENVLALQMFLFAVSVPLLFLASLMEERRRAEEALKKSEQRLSSHLRNTPVAAIEWNLDFEVIEWNTAAEKIFGFSKDEALGKHAAGLIVPEFIKEHVNQVWNDLLENTGGFHTTNKNLTKDGRTITCDWNNTPLIDGSGKVNGVASLVQDITDQRMAEDILKENEASLHEAQQIARLGNWSWIVDTNIMKWSKELYRMTGRDYKKSPPSFEEYPLLYTKESWEKLSKAIDRCLKTGLHYDLELDMVHSNGQIIHTRAQGQSAKDKSGKVERLYGTVQDITEAKQLQTLTSRAERLETAGTIAGQVAHDFNNLLAPLLAYPEFIREELPHNNKAHAYLDSIEDASKKIADINQDLLTMGRRGHYNQKVLDLNRVVLKATQEIGLQIKTVTFKMELCEDLMKIKGGNAQIHRMLVNLLVNARDAMGEIGQITIKTENYYVDETSISFGRIPRGEYVKLTISDNGCGIPDDIITKIFDPFFSTKTADKKRGSGLGLSIVDAVMKDHKGYIDLSSMVGHGTSFFLFFPITREDAGSDKSEHLAEGTESVLIVDDDEIQRDVTSQLLKKLGYKITTVESGEKAIEFLRENPQDLVILDMIMPDGFDGTETYQHILEINSHQKAIILSGFSESDRVLEAQKMGAGAFVRKPVTKSDIATAVRTELDRK